jgi:hypothetical protein
VADGNWSKGIRAAHHIVRQKAPPQSCTIPRIVRRLTVAVSFAFVGSLCVPGPCAAQRGSGAPADRGKIVPAIDATPNPVPAGPGDGSTVVTWTTGDDSDGRVKVAINGGIEEVLAQGPSGKKTIDWIDGSSIYEFRLYSMGTFITRPRQLASVTVTRARIAPSATPPEIRTTVNAASGPSASVTVTWSTGDGTDGLVFVRTDGGPQKIFAQGPVGSEVADWLDGHLRYEFELYVKSTPQALLAVAVVPPTLSTVVRRAADGEQVGDLRARSFLTAIPNPVLWGLRPGRTEIEWGLATGAGRILMSVNGGPPTLFAAGEGGTVTAQPVRAGSRYQFSLYSDKAPDEVLASVTVTRDRPYAIWIGSAAGLGLATLLLGRRFVKRRVRRD